MAEKLLVTQEGLDELLREQHDLIHRVRQEVIVELQEARAQGDLSENADYDAARDRQAQVEARIRDLESMISNAELIAEEKSSKNKKTVSLGSTVTLLDKSDNTKMTYTIVGSIESDPVNGRLSNASPLAMAIMDKKVGETISISNVETPYDVEILELKK